MEIVTGAMSTLLPKLADLIKEEYNLQKSVRAEIQILKTELEYMEAALRMVAEAPIEQQPPNPLVKLWTRDVRELSYDLEDSIDAFMVHIANDAHAPTKAKKHSFRAFMERSMNLLRRGKIRHNIGLDIEEYRRRIKEVKERSDRYTTVNNIGAKPIIAPSVDFHLLSALYTKVTDLVGTQQKSDDLVKMLMEGGDEASKRHLKVFSIVGFGGLGKTTLARVVYEELKGRFDCGAFVSVSHNPNIKNILSNILRDCGHLKYKSTWDETRLINELRDFLREKRYLIVIDDIWETSVWKTIQYALDDNKLGSRVISTTRNLDVAEEVGGIYKLQPLSHADSRKLFYLRIFGTEENCIPNELAEVSENILRKCAGVPLAIVIIASMLANGKENTHKYWSKVYQILGSGMEDSPDVIKDMRRILSISYYHLPPRLKSCMLYLCSYPEDAKISTKDLILKWVGEGFILKARGKSCYEVGEDYINELMNRSLIQPSNIDPDSNKATHCYVHDMVLDLITNLSNEDGFLTTFDGRWPICPPNMIRRLSLQSSDEEYSDDDEEYLKLLSTVSFDHVRSLSAEAFDLVPSLSAFPVLRLLDLSGCWQVNNHYFKDICHLFHLRYLRLSFTSITEIPKEIRNLKFLQVLDVSGTKVYELPSTFVQLSKLMYLLFDSLMGIPDGFGNLKDLQVLDGSIVVQAPTTLHKFSGLTELRCVQLQFNEWDESYDKLGMISFEYLQMMDISIRMVPRWMSSLSTLTKLRMQLLTLGEEDLQVLGSIPSLSDLSIRVMKPKECRDKKLVVINSHSFLCLKKFKLSKTVMVVVFALGAMEKLEKLVLTFGVKETTDHLAHSGFGLENLSSLVSITVQMNCHKANPKEVKAAKAAIQNAVRRNPNSPRLDMPVEKKVVLKVDLHDMADKKRIQDCLGANYEIFSMAIDMKESKVTVVSFMDPVDVVTLLRRVWGPVKRMMDEVI